MTQAELIVKIQAEFKGLSSELVDDDYTNAYAAALEDLPFECPTTDEFQIKWLKQRTKRHLIAYLYDQSLTNFDVPKAKLNQLVGNYQRRIRELDTEFEYAKMENPVLFGLCDNEGDAFGHTVNTGFVQDPLTGEDLTYEVDNNTLINNRRGDG